MELSKEAFKFSIINQLRQDDSPIHSIMFENRWSERESLDNPYKKEQYVLFEDFSLIAKFFAEYGNSLTCSVSFEDDTNDQFKSRNDVKTLQKTDSDVYYVERIAFSGVYIIFSLESIWITLKEDYQITQTTKSMYATIYDVEEMKFHTEENSRIRNMNSLCNIRNAKNSSYVDLEISNRFYQEYNSFCLMNKLDSVRKEKLRSALFRAKTKEKTSPMLLIMEYLRDYK